MLDNSFTQVADELDEMFQSYPRLRMSDPVRQKTVRVFWKHLRKHSLEAVLEAIELAPSKHPKSAPSVGELLALVGAKKQGGTTEEARRVDFVAREKKAAEDARDLIPRHPEEQARYVAGAGSEHERMTRLWEVEDANRGEHPHRDTPKPIGRERLKVISDLMAKLTERADELKEQTDAA